MTDYERICRAMSEPEFYPHEVSQIERKDTHISTVFLTCNWAYKIKKPVVFEFLDFRSLEDRKNFCKQELNLNQRLSSDVYINLVEILEDKNKRINLKKGKKIVEYAVKMVQLPEEANLKTLLKAKLVDYEQIKSIGRMLSDFYKKADQNKNIDYYGKQEVILYNIEENFRAIEPFVKKLPDKDQWEFICQVSRAFLHDHYDLLEERIKSRRIRDGHGDLRADHIYLYNGIQIIDCIEFKDRFRYGDTALDLSFLHMDLEHMGFYDFSRELLSAYAKCAVDPQIFSLLDFYSAYRAVVRLKVSLLQRSDLQIKLKKELINDIKIFFYQANQYSILFSRPTLFIFCGLPATGKSTFAKKTAELFSIPLFQSDTIRKQNDPKHKSKVISFNEGLYRPVIKGRVYARLIGLAQEKLKQGKSVVLDATFSQEKWRRAAKQMAADSDANIIFAELTAEEDAIKFRLKQREYEAGESDARLIHFKQLIADFEPFQQYEQNTHFNINTERNSDEIFVELLSKCHSSKCAQVKEMLSRLV